MFAKLSAVALALVLTVPALAQTTAAITSDPAPACTGGTSASGSAPNTCAAVKSLKLGSNITPVASSEHESGEHESSEGEGEDD